MICKEQLTDLYGMEGDKDPERCKTQKKEVNMYCLNLNYITAQSVCNVKQNG